MHAHKVRIVEDGKLSIPEVFRRQLGVGDGDVVELDMVAGVLHVRRPSHVGSQAEPHSRQDAIAAAQSFVRNLVPEGVSLSDELIADRREEAKRE